MKSKVKNTEKKIERTREREGEGEETGGSMNQWADRKKSEAQFAYNADEEAERW